MVKPTVSGAARTPAATSWPRPSGRWPVAHVGRLTAAGRTAMIQPYLAAVDTAGETAVLCYPDAPAS